MFTNVEIIYPKLLPVEKKREISHNLFAQVHNKIFSGIDEDKFYKIVVAPDSKLTKIKIYYDKNQDPLGYTSFHVYEIKLDKVPIVSVMSEMAMFPNVCGKNKAFQFYAVETLKYKLLHPLVPMYAIETVLNPELYKKASQFLLYFYPKHNIKTPEYIIRLIQKTAQHFSWNVHEKEGAYVRKTDWIFRDKSRALVGNPHNPHLNYFKTLVPDNQQGYALVICTPITVVNVSVALFRRRFYLIFKKLKHIQKLMMKFLHGLWLKIASLIRLKI